MLAGETGECSFPPKKVAAIVSAEIVLEVQEELEDNKLITTNSNEEKDKDE